MFGGPSNIKARPRIYRVNAVVDVPTNMAGGEIRGITSTSMGQIYTMVYTTFMYKAGGRYPEVVAAGGHLLTLS